MAPKVPKGAGQSSSAEAALEAAQAAVASSSPEVGAGPAAASPEVGAGPAAASPELGVGPAVATPGGDSDPFGAASPRGWSGLKTPGPSMAPAVPSTPGLASYFDTESSSDGAKHADGGAAEIVVDDDDLCKKCYQSLQDEIEKWVKKGEHNKCNNLYKGLTRRWEKTLQSNCGGTSWEMMGR